MKDSYFIHFTFDNGAIHIYLEEQRPNVNKS